MDYCFRQIAKRVYEVRGFEDTGKTPVKSYTIDGNYCSCPAHVPYCKHMDMKDTLLKSGGVEGAFIDEDTRAISRLPNNLTDSLEKNNGVLS